MHPLLTYVLIVLHLVGITDCNVKPSAFHLITKCVSFCLYLVLAQHLVLSFWRRLFALGALACLLLAPN